MDTILNFLKYFGLLIATVSSLIGIISDFKKEDKNGKQKITTGGKLAIMLTLAGLITSAVSSYLQDRKDENKAMQQIRDDNKKQIDDIKRFQHISSKQDSISREENKALFNEQLENSKFLFKQMLVENYLETAPEDVDLVIEVPYSSGQVFSIIDSCHLRFEWSSNFGDRTKKKKHYYFSGIIRRINSNDYFFYKTHEFVTDTITGKDVLVTTERSIEIELKKISNSVSCLVLPLKYFNYTVAPWGKVIDFRTNNFSFEMTKFKKKINFDFSNEEQGGTPFSFVDNGKGLVKGYIQFDNKYVLRVYNYDYLRRRKGNISEPWKDFVEDILSKIL